MLLKTKTFIKPWIVGFLFMLPLLAIAQEDPNLAIEENSNLIQSLGLLGGIAIAPFAALFVTSLVSVLGLGNEFIAENPVLGNWITVVISGILTFAPLLPKLLKSTAVIGQAIDWLNDRAGAVVGLIVLISPYFTQALEPTATEAVTLGFMDFGTSPYLYITLAVAIPYLIIVMTVRSFFGILIFLSPIPTLDAIFEVAKQGLSVGMVLLYLAWPEGALFMSAIIFIISFFLYRKAKRLMAFFSYLYLKPIGVALGFKKVDLLPSHLPSRVNDQLEGPRMVVQVALKTTFRKWKQRQLVYMALDNSTLRFIRPRWFGMTEVEEMPLTPELFSSLTKKWTHYQLKSDSSNLIFQLNLGHGTIIQEIEDLLMVDEKMASKEEVPQFNQLAKVMGQRK